MPLWKDTFSNVRSDRHGSVQTSQQNKHYTQVEQRFSLNPCAIIQSQQARDLIILPTGHRERLTKHRVELCESSDIALINIRTPIPTYLIDHTLKMILLLFSRTVGTPSTCFTTLNLACFLVSEVCGFRNTPAKALSC